MVWPRLKVGPIWLKCNERCMDSPRSCRGRQALGNYWEIYFKCLFIFERERERKAGREGDRESQAVSTLSAQSPTWGSISWTMRSWPEPKSRVRHFTGAPWEIYFNCSKRGACIAQLVKHLTLGFGSGRDLTVHEFELGLHANSAVCLVFSLSLSLCPSPTHALSLSPRQK